MDDHFLTQSWDTTDTSLPELSFSIAHIRGRNLCGESLEMRPRGVLGVALLMGAGASSQNPAALSVQLLQPAKAQKSHAGLFQGLRDAYTIYSALPTQM